MNLKSSDQTLSFNLITQSDLIDCFIFMPKNFSLIHCLIELSINGTMGQWDNGTMGQWDNGTIGQ